MTAIRLDASTLNLHFPGWEALMVGRSWYTVDRDAITRAELLPGWSSEVLGTRSGLVVSGRIKVGTFRHPSGVRRLVAMRRGLPLLRLTLAGEEFDELLVSDAGAGGIVDALGKGVRR
ncbi:hypothetical protein [Cellulomonas cellasea]|uniref:Bacterial Pleckstrin homology domain-containing protein n=2 Tax=Cellulomonas cellasea TaxID=43670 RepID=A0A0A0B639_9CELL|nr:hypothetical protein [Cellulomonas cellasea]KGM01637.1 hypothetical protein Q760_18180 [Cellulomonas cellasea DSM 20118]GEA87984.1 hypothetical protein CCE01nite_19330 [Cellulomonas cellasea]